MTTSLDRQTPERSTAAKSPEITSILWVIVLGMVVGLITGLVLGGPIVISP